MKVLQLTDTHFGAHLHVDGAPAEWSRSNDHVRAAEAALTAARELDVDLVVHTGDLFDSAHPGRHVAVACEMLATAAQERPVVVLAGNHDKRGLAPFVAQLPGVRLVDRPERLTVAGLDLACIPYQRFAETFAAAAAALDIASADLVLAHQTFHGHTVPGFTFRAGNHRDVVGPAHLPGAPITVLCGHIHTRQVVRCGPARVITPGSTERTAFVEALEPKGYAVVHLEREVRWSFHDTPARPMVVVRSEHDLVRVVPGALVRAEAAWCAPARDLGGWIAPGRVGKDVGNRGPRARQLGLLGGRRDPG